MIPLVLYNGPGRWTAALTVRGLFPGVPKSLGRLSAAEEYLLVETGRFGPRDLPDEGNLADVLFRMESSRNPQQLRRAIGMAEKRLGKPGTGRLREAFTLWLHSGFLPSRFPGIELPDFTNLKEAKAMIETPMTAWIERQKERASQKGIQNGIQKGEALLVARQLGRKFGALPEAMQAAIASADPEKLTLWGERLLTAKSLEQVFAIES